MAKFNTLCTALDAAEVVTYLPIGDSTLDTTSVLFGRQQRLDGNTGLPVDIPFEVEARIAGVVVPAGGRVLYDSVFLPFSYGQPAIDISAPVGALAGGGFLLSFLNADGLLVASYGYGVPFASRVDGNGLYVRVVSYEPDAGVISIHSYVPALVSAAGSLQNLTASISVGNPFMRVIPAVPDAGHPPFDFWGSLEDSFFAPDSLAIAVDGTATEEAQETLRVQTRFDSRFRDYVDYEVSGVRYKLDGLTRVDRGLVELSMKRVVNG